MSTAMMLLAMRRKVVRVSERLWPRKSLKRGGSVLSGFVHVSGGWRGEAYDLAFIDVAGLVEEGVHCGWSAICMDFLLRVVEVEQR
jgi:hypothetical protein